MTDAGTPPVRADAIRTSPLSWSGETADGHARPSGEKCVMAAPRPDAGDRAVSLTADTPAHAYARQHPRPGRLYCSVRAVAHVILRAGGVVVVFPEGTRIQAPDALGSPHHGAGRLALDTGAPIVPAAISGTSHLWRGALPQAKRVQLTFLPAVSPPSPASDDHATDLIDQRVWPAVRQEYRRLRASPGVIAAGLTALGLSGGLLARRRLERSRPPRLLGFVQPRRSRRRTRRQQLKQQLRR